MKLKMTTSMAGPTMSLIRGDEHDFGDEEAVRIVRAGYATTTNANDEKSVKAAIAELEKAEAAAVEKAAAAKAKAEKGAK